MTAPLKSHGLTEGQRSARCTGKHRWADECSARAGALFSIETYRKVLKLYVYRCPHCRGWHLTRKEQKNSAPEVMA